MESHELFITPTDDQRFGHLLLRNLRDTFDQCWQRIGAQSSNNRTRNATRIQEGINAIPTIPENYYELNARQMMHATAPFRRLAQDNRTDKELEEAVQELSSSMAAHGQNVWIPAGVCRTFCGDGYSFMLMCRERMELDVQWQGPYKTTSPRTATGPKWSGNSCAFDTTAMLLLFMDAGILQCDQLHPAALARLNSLQRVWLMFVHYRWEDFSAVDRRRQMALLLGYIRHLRWQSETYNSAGGKYNDEMDMYDIVVPALEVVPQATLTSSLQLVCDTCNSIKPGNTEILKTVCVHGTYAHSEAARKFANEISVKAGTFGAALSAFFLYEDSFEPTDAEKCHCGGALGRMHVVEGQVPPRVLYYHTQLDAWKDKDMSWEAFQLTYYRPNDDSTVSFHHVDLEPVAVISWVGKNHFTLHMRNGPDSWSRYDGLRKSGQVELFSFADMLRTQRSLKTQGTFVLFQRMDCFPPDYQRQQV